MLSSNEGSSDMSKLHSLLHSDQAQDRHNGRLWLFALLSARLSGDKSVSPLVLSTFSLLLRDENPQVRLVYLEIVQSLVAHFIVQLAVEAGRQNSGSNSDGDQAVPSSSPSASSGVVGGGGVGGGVSGSQSDGSGASGGMNSQKYEEMLDNCMEVINEYLGNLVEQNEKDESVLLGMFDVIMTFSTVHHGT
jgi:hypothetical protein